MSAAAAIVGASGGAPLSAGLIALVIWLLSMYFARKIAIRKGRSPWLGLVLGCLLSWLGLILVAVLPRKGPRVTSANAGFTGYASPAPPPLASRATPPRATESTPPPLPAAAPAPETPQAAPPAPEAAPPSPVGVAGNTAACGRHSTGSALASA